MSFAELGVVAIGLYIALLVGIAEVARRARKSALPADHFLAGRSLGAFVLFFTLYATSYSGNSLLGYPGEGYRRGFVWMMSPGFMLAVVVAFHALVPRFRPIAIARGFLTPGDWIRERFGEGRHGVVLRRIVALLMTVALANYLLAQLRAMGLVTEELSDGRIPYAWGVVGLAAMILFYEHTGGMRAVAWTDALQGTLMLVGLAFLMGWLLHESGGFSGLTERVAAVRPDAVAVPDARACLNWASTIVLVAIGGIVYPQALQRVFASRDARSLKRALAAMGFMPFATTAVVALIGIAAIAHLGPLGQIEADRVMPRLLAAWSEAGPGATFVALLIFVGALAAIMSTADSVILTLSSLVAGDLLDQPRGDAATTRLGKRLAVGIMLLMVVAALFPPTTLWRLIELKMEVLIQCAPSFLLALHWRGLRADATIVGACVGALIAGGAALADVSRVGGIHPGLVALGLNVACCVAISLWRGPERAREGEPS